MKDDVINIAFVGAGIVSEIYAKAIPAISNVRFCGAFDPLSDRAASITRKLGGTAFKDLDELLRDKSIDATIVMTPTHAHVETATRCMIAGKHVLLEKPVAETLDDIDLLKQVSAETGRVCMPAHNYIYSPAVQRAKRLITEGKFGQITSLWILYNVFHSEDLAKRYGGVIRAVCVHHAYSLIYLLGRPRTLNAVSSNIHYKELKCEDQVMMTCTTDTGAIANLWCSFAANDPTSDPWTVLYKILGTKGGLTYTWSEAQFEDKGGPAWGIPSYLESFENELNYFVNHALKGVSPLSTLEDASDALRIICAAERSITDGGQRVVLEQDSLC